MLTSTKKQKKRDNFERMLFSRELADIFFPIFSAICQKLNFNQNTKSNIQHSINYLSHTNH